MTQRYSSSGCGYLYLTEFTNHCQKIWGTKWNFALMEFMCQLIFSTGLSWRRHRWCGFALRERVGDFVLINEDLTALSLEFRRMRGVIPAICVLLFLFYFLILCVSLFIFSCMFSLLSCHLLLVYQRWKLTCTVSYWKSSVGSYCQCKYEQQDAEWCRECSFPFHFMMIIYLVVKPFNPDFSESSRLCFVTAWVTECHWNANRAGYTTEL